MYVFFLLLPAGKRVDSTEVTHRTKSGSLDKGSSSSTTPPLKRFSFQPKPISASNTKGPPKSMSLDRGDSSFFKSALDKMMAHDRHTKRDKLSLDHGKSFDNAKLVEKIKSIEEKPIEKEKPVEQVAVSQTMTTPTEKTINESVSLATPTSPPIKAGDTSTDSNTSLMSKDRSNSSLQQPEAK